MSKTASKTRILVEGALMIALTTALSYIKFMDMPMGGSVTLEMMPIILMGYRHGVKWGCFTGFVHGFLQMILGFSNVLYCTTLLSQIGCILLDYILAFTVLGLSGLFANVIPNKFAGLLVGSILACALRFGCSYLSGYLLYGSWAPEGMHPAYYSLIYNGAYMLPSAILVCVVLAILYKVAPKLFVME